MQRYMASKNRPQHALEPRVLLLAHDGATLVGYIVGHLTKRFDCDGELQWIYVVAAQRRTQLAVELLRLLARWFVEHGAKRVCVSVADGRARSFYSRNGAVPLNDEWMVWENIGAVLEQK